MGAKGKSMVTQELSWEAEEPKYHSLVQALLYGEKN
jgi:hypothetical protein